MSTVTQTSSSSNACSFIWPQDLNSLALKPEDVKILEFFLGIQKFNFKQDPRHTEPNCIFYSVLKRGCKAVDGTVLPRTTIVSCNRSIVVLNEHGGMPFVKDKGLLGKIKYSWDAEKGELLVKKPVNTPFEYLIYSYFFKPETVKPIVRKGIAKIALIHKCGTKVRIFEKCYPHTIASLSQLDRSWSFNMISLTAMQHTLGFVHSICMIRPQLFIPDSIYINDSPRIFSVEGRAPTYHGNISPSNIVCTPIKGDPTIFKFKLIDWFWGGQTRRLKWTRSWGAPEIFKFLRKDYKNMTAESFNCTYGAKRDTWSFALIVASLLNGAFGKLHPTDPVPNLPCIFNKLKVNDQGIIDDSDIIHLTQKEIDDDIEKLISKIKDMKLPQEAYILSVIEAIHKGLNIDPDKRPTLHDFFNRVNNTELLAKLQ